MTVLINAPTAGRVDVPQQTLAWRYLREAGDSGLHVFRIERHNDNGPHDHVFHEIVYVEEGTADHLTADGVRKLRPGDVIVIRPQVWHGYSRPRGLTIINCLIDSHLMQRLAPLLGQVSGAFELLRQRPRDPRQTPPTVLHASPAERAVVLGRLQTIIAEQRTKTNGWQAAATAALLELLVVLARLAHGDRAADATTGANTNGAPDDAAAPAPPSDRTQQAVLDVATILETHFREPVSLTELADRVHLSPGHLSRSFSRRMGMGIVQYLHRMRAEEACRLLRCTDAPVARVAAQVGYDEIAYFSRCFRAQIGQSPAAYRKAWLDRH